MSKEALAHLRKVDAKLAKIIDAAEAFAIAPETKIDLFHALSRSIVYQQLSGKAAATIYGRLEAKLPKALGKWPAALLALSDEELRGCGLSRQKTAALRDLAQKVIDKTVPTAKELHGLDDEAIIERLTTVRGIGRWSVEMLLMFRMGRLDVMPSTDLGVRKGHQLLYRPRGEMLTPKELHAFGERWRPYRSVASWYMWRVVELRTKR